MTSRPASLGADEAPEYKKTWEMHELPKNRQGILAAIESILKPGGVQKLVLEVGKPIRVSRMVPASAVPDDLPAELIDNDIYAAARNTEIGSVEKEKDPFSQLYKAFFVLADRGSKPRAIIVPQLSQFFLWLGRPQSKRVFGVDIITNKDVPDETALLVGADQDDEEVINYSVRFELDVPGIKEKYEANRGEDVEQRSGGQDDEQASGAVGVPAGGNERQGQREQAQGRNPGRARQVRR